MTTTSQHSTQFIGQTAIMQQIQIMIAASKLQKIAFGHTLLVGSAGMGKTTIASLIAEQLATNFHFIQGISINKASDIISLLTNLKPFDIIFFDEIHIINSEIIEILYPALEEGYIKIVIGKSFSNKIIKIELPPFTLIGATNKVALLNKALLSRFVNLFQLQPYQPHEIKLLIKTATSKLNWQLTEQIIDEISQYCRPIPRTIINLIRQMHDYCLVKKIKINPKIVGNIMEFLQIYPAGINFFELSYLKLFHQQLFLSIETICSLLNEEIKNIETTYEPFLLQLGLVVKSSKGRSLTAKGTNYLNTNLAKFP